LLLHYRHVGIKRTESVGDPGSNLSDTLVEADKAFEYMLEIRKKYREALKKMGEIDLEDNTK
jgi:hypothetical protein